MFCVLKIEVICRVFIVRIYHVFQVIQSQPTAKQSSMATWFKNLMEGIERNLLTKNRDRYIIYYIYILFLIPQLQRCLIFTLYITYHFSFIFAGLHKICRFSDVTLMTV